MILFDCRKKAIVSRCECLTWLFLIHGDWCGESCWIQRESNYSLVREWHWLALKSAVKTDFPLRETRLELEYHYKFLFRRLTKRFTVLGQIYIADDINWAASKQIITATHLVDCLPSCRFFPASNDVGSLEIMNKLSVVWDSSVWHHQNKSFSKIGSETWSESFHICCIIAFD